MVIASTGSQGLVLSAEQVERAQPAEARRAGLLHRHRGTARSRSCHQRPRRLLSLRHRRSRTGRRGEHRCSSGRRRPRGGHRPARKRLPLPTPGASRSTWCPRSRRCAAAPRRSEPRELERALARLEGLSPKQRLAVESLSAQIVNKLLHLPTVRLKEAAAAARGPTRNRAASVRPPGDERRAMVVRLGSRGSRLALTQAELAAWAIRDEAGYRGGDRADHDHGRPGSEAAVRRDRRPRGVREGARGSAARPPSTSPSTRRRT